MARDQIETLDFRGAVPADLPQIQCLLQNSQLPIDDFTIHLTNFLLCFNDQALVGAISLEIYAEIALLRSLAVSNDYRGIGLGQDLTEKILTSARKKELQHLYLLTNTAVTFFEKFGFVSTARTQAPKAILQTTSFRDLCPASAILMHLRLEPSERD